MESNTANNRSFHWLPVHQRIDFKYCYIYIYYYLTIQSPQVVWDGSTFCPHQSKLNMEKQHPVLMLHTSGSIS